MKTMAPQEAAENEWNTKRKRKINQRTPPTTVSSLFLLLLLLLLLLLFLLLRRLGIPFFCHVRRISFLRADRERKRTVTSRSLSTSLSNEASSCQTPPDSTNIADEFIEYRRLLVSCCCFFLDIYRVAIESGAVSVVVERSLFLPDLPFHQRRWRVHRIPTFTGWLFVFFLVFYWVASSACMLFNKALPDRANSISLGKRSILLVPSLHSLAPRATRFDLKSQWFIHSFGH